MCIIFVSLTIALGLHTAGWCYIMDLTIGCPWLVTLYRPTIFPKIDTQQHILLQTILIHKTCAWAKARVGLRGKNN